MGGFKTIVDFTTQKMTLLDVENKRYGTFAADQLATELSKIFSEMPAQAREAMAAMKFGADSKMTGRTATIQGIEAEEREAVITIEGPPMPNVPPGPMMRMVVQFWTAKDSETMRVPAIRELKGYNLWAYATMNPAASLEKMFQQMPGMGDVMGKFMKEMQASKSALLRMHSSDVHARDGRHDQADAGRTESFRRGFRCECRVSGDESGAIGDLDRAGRGHRVPDPRGI